ncbi:hypothetical protein LTR49_027511 [Elasticomyces elasticus]|nr:hypothetical protein LTR49_027511 [Elasticomyces elasticus]
MDFHPRAQPQTTVHKDGYFALLDTEGRAIAPMPIFMAIISYRYGWEVDSENFEFVTVNSQGRVLVPMKDCHDGRTLLPKEGEQQHDSPAPVEADDETDDLIRAVNTLELQGPGLEPTPHESPDETWDKLYRDPKFRRTMYFSHCILREIKYLKSLCHQYPEDDFIRAGDEQENTGVLLAATEEDGLETVRWLHAHGGSVDRANIYGRTPLMEAALWGRLRTVQYLAQQNIDFGARDANGMQAVELAAEPERNAKERNHRAGEVYREPSDSSKQREQISALLARLTSPALQRQTMAATPQRRAFFSRRPNGNLEIYRPQEFLELPPGPYSLQKAFATLDRGPDYPIVNAMSGFSHPGWPNVLDNQEWTRKAEDLTKFLGLPDDKSKAAHVEPQLLAYLLDRHSLHLLDDEDRRKGLEGVMPAYDLEPVITVSKPKFCDYCEQFWKQFKYHFPEFNIGFRFVGDVGPTPIRVTD